MSLPVISPAGAKLLIAKGAILIDIRDTGEHALERIPQARSMPLSKLGETGVGEGNGTIIFYCKSGYRTQMNAPLLAKAASAEAFILEGGIDAWKKAGLEVMSDSRQPISMMRQVQIAAGSLALAGTILGFAVHPGFHLLPGAIGAGLIFSGMSGTCAMADVLRLMPWNRVAQA